jgi:hypothetical protein
MPRRRADNLLKNLFGYMNSECKKINGSGGSAVRMAFRATEKEKNR